MIRGALRVTPCKGRNTMKLPVVSAALLAAVMADAVSAAAQDVPAQGGRMIVTYQDDITTLDPAIGYDWQNPAMMQAIFDGLMDYKPGTTELTPDLAESYAISEDGRTYTFKLRQGVKFHNGRVLTAADVKYTLDRLANPATQSPGQPYFSAIKGYDEFVAGAASDLSGVATPDDHTVVIEMSRPNAPFLNVLAMHFGSIVPQEEVAKYGADFGRNPVGTGAFKLTEWRPGQQLIFERNRDYYHPGIPYLDQVVIEIGQDPTVNVLRLRKGEVDLVGDGIPPAQFTDIVDDPANKDLVAIGEQLHTGYITMNVTMAPFDSVKVRQAINMAINKDRIVTLINNRGTATAQVMPPAMPGFDPQEKGYAFDPEAAKRLLAEAGHPDGFATELYAMNVDPNPRIAQAIQQDLAKIGVKVELRTLAQSEVITAGGAGQAPMIWSGGMAWIADFPDPSGFYWPILSCNAAAPGGWNWAKYCNEALDARAAAADSIVATDRSAERVGLWRSIYADAMKEAPWVPVFNQKNYVLHSAKIAADPVYFVSPTHIPMHYEYISATTAQ